MKVWVYVEVYGDYGGDPDIENIVVFSTKEKAERWCVLTEQCLDNIWDVEIDSAWQPEMENKWPYAVTVYTIPEQPPKAERWPLNEAFQTRNIPHLELFSFTDMSSEIPRVVHGGWHFYCWAENDIEAIRLARQAVKEREKKP